MKKYDILLFDLDGTLTDSAPGILNCARHALNIMGRPEPENMLRFVGPPLIDSFIDFCRMTREDAQEAVRLYRERYGTVGLFENAVYGGIAEMLSALKAAGYRLAVATSKPEVFAVRILDKFGLSGYFEFIGGGLVNGERNEKHEVIEYVLENLGNPERGRVLMIGDRKFDVIGARQTGLDCLYALWGYGGKEEAEESGALYTAETPQELTEMLTGA
ncbi:MAG: HAD-IA family hydrolase [Ruminococcus sp.]|nr:HAD-IA family hydrolase [Ruminococcus sp.]